jgi:hypothetical protein
MLPPGWFSSHDIRTYRRFIKLLPTHGKMVELGAWKGRSLCAIADLILTKDLEVAAVDTFRGTDGDVSHDEARRGIDILYILQSNLQDFGLADHVKVYSETTVKAVEHFADNSLNLVFLDADHNTDKVYQDVMNWYPKLVNHGVLIGHDWVRDTVRHGVGKTGFVYHRFDNIWWLVRNRVSKPWSRLF